VARRTIVLISSGIVLLVAGAAAAITLWPKPATPLFSAPILDQANFDIYYPGGAATGSSDWVINRTATTYDKSSGVLSIHGAQNGTSTTMVLTEQATPGVFSDVPTQYSKMLSSLNEYNELQTPFGTIALTHPTELAGGQTAVVNKGSTLVFARPSANLSDGQWQAFFNSLRIFR
jgi:hypothetical protein